MRIPVRPGRSRVLAIAASVLLSSAALTAAMLPTQAKAAPAAETVTVANPGATTEPLETEFTLPLSATDSVTADYPLTWSASPNLTALGLTIASTDPTDGKTAAITGTVTAADAGTYTITVTATDSGLPPVAGSATFALTLGNTITVTAPKTETTWLGLKASAQATATDSDKSRSLTWTAKPLPPGLSISQTGLISGRTTGTGVFKTVVTATDGTGSAGSATITWNVGTPITVHSAGSVTVTAGRSVAYKLAYTDVVRGDKVTWTATRLPAGVGFQPSSLLLYGWPAAAGTDTVVFNAKGSLGTVDQKVLKLIVKAAPDKGAVGQIHLALDGKCLQDPGGRTANGTWVKIENCVAGATERWTVASDNTVRVNGHCLNIAGSGGASGRQLQLWNCNGSPRQVWLQGTAGELVNPASGLCATDPGSRRGNGVAPTMGACHIRSYEQWTLPAQPIFTPVGGRCADDPLGLGYNGTVVDMYACNGTAGQAWDFEPSGMIRISQYANVCLTMRKSQPVLWVCGTVADQKWSLNRTGGLGSELEVGGACLATKSLTAGNAAKLVMTKCSAGNPLDLWHIE